MLVSQCLQINLDSKSTCFGFKTAELNQKREAYFNYEVSKYKVHLDVYFGADVIATTRKTESRSHYLMIQSKEVGYYRLCFEKQSPNPILLHFDLIDEVYFLQHYTGKDDMYKVIGSAQKMINQLKRIDIGQKTMLSNHHRRTTDLQKLGNFTSFMTIIKILVAAAILTGQFLFIRKIFK